MDWSKVELPEFKNTRLTIQRFGKLDYAKLLVIARLIEKSQSQIGQKSLYTYLQRTWPEHEARLTVEANSRGLSLEECFVAMVHEALGDE